MGMNHEEALARCAQLQAEHENRATHTFAPKQLDDGTWAVAQLGIPPVADSLQAETRAESKPPTADDPRDTHMINVGPNVGPA